MKTQYEANRKHNEVNSSTSSSDSLKGSSPPRSSGGGGSSKGDWTSWAFSGMEGLTKSMEKVTVPNEDTKDSSALKLVEKGSDEVMSVTAAVINTSQQMPTSEHEVSGTIGGWGDEDDLDLDDPVEELHEQVACGPDPVRISSTGKPEHRTPIPKKIRKETKAVGVIKMTVHPNEKDSWDDF